MPTWNELKEILLHLQAAHPSPLRNYPDPTSDTAPPFNVGLQAWATDLAAELHDRFGEDLELTVGGIPYPHGQRTHTPDITPESADITAALDGPLTVASGHHTMHDLLVTNHTDQALHVRTNRHLTAVVVDPETDRVVGSYTGPQRMPGRTFTIEPGDTTRIPLLVGTDSHATDLGYAVPPGNWAVRATLEVGDNRTGDNRTLGTPALPITVTDARD